MKAGKLTREVRRVRNSYIKAEEDRVVRFGADDVHGMARLLVIGSDLNETRVERLCQQQVTYTATA